jgi:hypothetical protein
MSRNSRPRVRDFRDDYATCNDFCEVFRTNTTQLYLLAFLLTANHHEAGECFVGAMDNALAGRNVFKGWEESWSKRCLIEHAIGAIICQSGRGFRGGENKLQTFLDAVTQLKSIQRFVFVMTVLAGYSVKETALLLARPHTGVRSQPANRSASAISRT